MKENSSVKISNNILLLLYSCCCVHAPVRQPSSKPVSRHASSMTSSQQSLGNDVTAGESPGAPDDVIDDDDDDALLEKDIVRRRIDLFEKQVSKNSRCRIDCVLVKLSGKIRFVFDSFAVNGISSASVSSIVSCLYSCSF